MMNDKTLLDYSYLKENYELKLNSLYDSISELNYVKY